MKTKIFHVIECGDLTGAGRMVANICNRLDHAKFDISLIFATRPPFTPQEFESIFNKNIRKIYIPDMVRPPEPKKDFSAFWKLYKLFKKEMPDIVHGHSSKGGFLARFAALFAGIPQIFYSSYGYSFRMTTVSLITRIFYLLLEAIASPIGYIVANAPNEVNIAKKLARQGRVLPYYNGIDISGITPKYPEKTQSPTVVACGRVTPAKNPSAFVRLCFNLENKFPEASFIWIGGCSKKETDRIQNHITKLKVKNLKITGWLERPDMLQIMGQADVFIHYSNWDALPTVVSEAMAFGKPVVGSNAVDQIIHGENGYVAKTEHELFDFTCQLLNSWELRNKMGKKARKTVEEKYTLDRLIKQLESAYLGNFNAI